MTGKLRTSRAIEPYLYPIALLTVAALLIELAALRILTRTAIHIPGLDRVAIGYRVISEVGRFAFGAGVVLIAILMIVVAIDGFERGRRVLAAVLSIFLMVAALAAVGAVGETALSVATLLAVLAVPFACLFRGSGSRPQVWVPPVLFVAVFTIAGLPLIVSGAAPDLGASGTGLWQVAEALALIAGASLVSRVAGPLMWKSVLVASLAGGIVLVSLVAQPSTIEILMLWNLGLAGYFHPLVYAAATASVVYAAHGAWHLGDRSVSIGVGLIVVGGIGLHSTIQSAAFLMGVVILSDPTLIRASAEHVVPSVAPSIDNAGASH